MRQELEDRKAAIKQKFFSLSSWDGLGLFQADLESDDPIARAFMFLVKSWSNEVPADPDAEFDPGHYLSEDLSAAVLGKCPVIFMGTNDWAIKPYVDQSAHMSKAQIYSKRLKKLKTIFSGRRLVVSVVPEKDYVLDKQYFQTGRFAAIDSAIYFLQNVCRELEIRFIYNDYLAPLGKYESIGDFEYCDTHLPARHYIQIFAKLLRTFGLDWRDIAESFIMKEIDFYGDLSKKFGSRYFGHSRSKAPCAKNGQIRVVDGTPSFAEPLGATWQFLVNENPLRTGKVLVLGDSHSSILAQNRLTYLLAATFERCEFFWNPLGVREDPQPSDADFVFMEISQRFLL